MYIEESFDLYSVGITNLNKRLTVYNVRGLKNFVVYKNLKTGNITKKEISFDRYCRFENKYRGKETKGYNRPSITTKVYDNKTGKEIL